MRTATADTRRALRTCAACGLIDAPYYDADGLCPLCSPEFDEGHGPNDMGISQNRPVLVSTTPDMNQPSSLLQQRALQAIDTYGGLRPAARKLGEMAGEKVNHGVIGMAAKGKDIPQARRVLGLPPKTVTIETCPDCGHIHRQLKSCTQRRKPNKRRLAFSLTDEQFARVRTVLDSHPGGRVAWLMQKIQENQ